MSRGIRDARTDFGIQCFLIAAINRMETPELGLEMVQTVLAHPRQEVIGIGMDYAEADNPPEKFWKAYRLAGARGLRRTAHACEDAPARNVETCLDLLEHRSSMSVLLPLPPGEGWGEGPFCSRFLKNDCTTADKR